MRGKRLGTMDEELPQTLLTQHISSRMLTTTAQ